MNLKNQTKKLKVLLEHVVMLHQHLEIKSTQQVICLFMQIERPLRTKKQWGSLIRCNR